MGRRHSATIERIAGLLLFAAVAIVALQLIRPWIAGQVGYDSAASVLFFDRIASGQRLEAFITVTPKPFLTLVDGVTYGLTHDWRAVSYLAIGAYALDVVLATALVRRSAGPVAVGFAAMGFLGSWALLEDASAAYAVSWALLGWLVAGLATTSRRPRYALAGVALLLASLARFETLILVGLIAGLLIVGRLAARRWPALAPPVGAWLLLIGLGALPVQMLHDWLLTGDPLWSEAVPAIASAGAAVRDPVELSRWLIGHYWAMGPLVLLGAIGVLGLARRRAWPILVGVTGLGLGVLAFLLILAARGVYVSNRYVTPADLALLLTAAFGVDAIRVPIVRALAATRLRDRRALRVALGVGAGMVAALLLVSPFGPLDNALRVKVRTNLAMFEAVDAAMPALTATVDATPGIRTVPPGASPRGPAERPTLLVPVLLRPRLAVQLDLPLTSIDGTDGDLLRTDGTYPSPGQVVYHDTRGDFPPAAFRPFEIDTPTTVGAIRLVPLATRPDLGYWLVKVEQP